MTSPIAGEREAKERAAFEAWGDKARLSLAFHRENDAVTYDSTLTEVAWRAWQARAALLEPVGEGDAPTELEMHRADYKACRDAGWESPGELLAGYKCLAQQDNAKARRIDELTALLAASPKTNGGMG